MNIQLEITPFENWFDGFVPPVFIAGPCAAESEKQVLETAHAIKKTGKVLAFRAGIWKPRSSPNSFEGVGKKGLDWLQTVKKETGLLMVVEVAKPKHVELCLNAGIDMVWLGARTTSNPFSVQEIVSALEGSNVAVLVKNPVNPDLSLWIGAMERLNKVGIKKIAAIHRGFYPFEKTILRNIPKWELMIELKRQFPQLPIICDPSHIAGDTRFIKDISQKALDLNVNGLMIEVHSDPKHALSDALQQLTPDELNHLINSLQIRSADSDDIDFTNHLEQYREQIDSIDTQLLELLAQRMNVVEQIGKYKSKNDVTILQLRRWEKILSTRTEIGEKLGLSENLVAKLLQLIHKESISKQTEIMNKIKPEDVNFD